MLGSIVLVILILLLIYFFVYPKFLKGKKKESQDKQKVDTSEVFGPQIEFGPSEAVYTPYSEISNYEIEGYSIEYDNGVIPYAKLSNAVEIIFNWRNRFGFINVTDLKFEWYAGTTTDANGNTIDALIESKEYNVASATGVPKDYFKTNYPPKVNEGQVQGYNSVSFKLPTTNETVSVMGDNYVIMSYKLKGSDDYTPVFSKQDLIDINTIINISEKDLSQTLDLKDTVKQTYTPGIAKSGDDAMKVTSNIDKTGYYIIPGAEKIEDIGNETIQYLIDRKDNGRIIMNPGKDNYHVKLMVEDTGKYIKYSFSNPERKFSFVDTYADANDFTIVEGEKENTVRFRLQNDNTDYFMTYTSISGEGRVLVMKSYDEVENDEYYGYDLSFLETSGNQDCEFEWEVTDPNDETYLTTGIRKKTFKVIRPQSGNGAPCLDTDGTTELSYTDGEIVEREENVNCALSEVYNWQGCSKDCGNGIEKAPITIEQKSFNEGKSCDQVKSEIILDPGVTIEGDEKDGYWFQKACNKGSCVSCKEHDQFLNWQFGGVGVSFEDSDGNTKTCSDITNETDCNNTAKRTGYQSWIEVCEWK
jgi:hypothetical protein